MPKYSKALKFHSDSIDRNRTAKQFRRLFPFSFGITREGILYILSAFLLSMAAINTGNNLLYIVLATMLSTIAVSGIVSRSSLKRLQLSLQMPENVFVGEKVSIKISMKNLKRIFPSFSISVQDPDMSRMISLSDLARRLFRSKKRQSGGSQPADSAMFRQIAYFPILRPGELRSELMVQSFPRRGLYRLQGFFISTRFPFGFFRRGEHIDATGEVLVYPNVQAISSFFHLLPFLPGHLEGHHVGQGENLLSMRKYHEDESARIIDWKATAKTGELMAREFAREEESKFCLILDTRIHGKADKACEDVFEKAVSLAASIAAHFIREGAGMEFLTPREHVPRGTGMNHLFRILRSLSVVKYERAKSTDTQNPWHPGSFGNTENAQEIEQILSDKVFKIIITSKPRGSFSSAIWRSSHVVFFNEL